MTNLDFVLGYYEFYKRRNVRYTQGGWLQPLTPENKNSFINNPNYPNNRDNLTIKNGILTAPVTMYAGDCNCTIKSYIDHLQGVDHQTTSMRKPCPDISIKDMLKQQCVDVSTDMNNILLGEYVVYGDKTHCGIYMGVIDGKRMIAEVTYRWENGLQLIDMDRPERKGLWTYHGKLWNFMDYKYKEASMPIVNPNPVVDVATLRNMLDKKVLAKRGDKSNYIKEIQRVLIAKGYSCGGTGADGDFGANTEKAVTKFQHTNGLTADGVVRFDTAEKLVER